jgi:hypothetical protein
MPNISDRPPGGRRGGGGESRAGGRGRKSDAPGRRERGSSTFASLMPSTRGWSAMSAAIWASPCDVLAAIPVRALLVAALQLLLNGRRAGGLARKPVDALVPTIAINGPRCFHRHRCCHSRARPARLRPNTRRTIPGEGAERDGARHRARATRSSAHGRLRDAAERHEVHYEQALGGVERVCRMFPTSGLLHVVTLLLLHATVALVQRRTRRCKVEQQPFNLK